MLCKISQNLEIKACAGVSFLTKQPSMVVESFRTSFFIEHLSTILLNLIIEQIFSKTLGTLHTKDVTISKTFQKILKSFFTGILKTSRNIKLSEKYKSLKKIRFFVFLTLISPTIYYSLIDATSLIKCTFISVLVKFFII